MNDLKEGEIYMFQFKKKKDTGKGYEVVNKRMRLLKKYRYHALFEDKWGIRTCYQYHDIKKLLEENNEQSNTDRTPHKRSRRPIYG